MIVVSGYYGYGNLGDEAILGALLRQLGELGLDGQDISVLSGDVTHTESQYGVRAVPRYGLQTNQSLRKARLCISGGGSLYQDVTSRRSLPYYVGIVELARIYGAKVVLYAQGIGPIRSRLYRRWVVRVADKAEAVTTRDPASAALLYQWGLPLGKAQVTADSVFADAVSLPCDVKQPARLKRLFLNVRPYTGWERQKEQWVQALLRCQQQLGLQQITFMALGPGDVAIGETLAHRVSLLEVVRPGTPTQAQEWLQQGDLFVTMRLHGVVFAACAGVLPVAVVYDPKVQALANALGLPVIQEEGPQALPQLLLELFQAGLQERVHRMVAGVQLLHERAMQNKSVLEQVWRTL